MALVVAQERVEHAVAGVPAVDAGFPSSFPSTWSADSSDTLLLGTELAWVPSRLVTALALAPALLEVPQATSLESALAQSVDCKLVAQVLLESGATAGSVTPVNPALDSAQLASIMNAVRANILVVADKSYGPGAWARLDEFCPNVPTLKHVLTIDSRGSDDLLASLDEAEQVAKTAAANSRFFFTLDTLEFLYRGGRIGNAQRLIGSTLNIKPILHIEDGTVASL